MILRIKHFIGNLGLLVLLLIPYSRTTVEVAFNRDVCDEHEFYVPYVKVSKTRKGPIVQGMYESGFMNLRNYSGLLCINGPAYVYLDLDESSNTFLKSEPQVFSHGCFGFNRRNIKDYKLGALTPLDNKTHVYGLRIYGVFLLGAQSDFRLSQFQWFRNPQFGYKSPQVDEDLVNGSSFGVVVNFNESISYCFKVQAWNVHGKVTGTIFPGDEATFCFREEQEGEIFDDVFRRNLTASSYNWTECDPSEPEIVKPTIDHTPPGPMPDFRIIDPAFLTVKGSPGKLFKGKNVFLPSGNIPFYSRPNPPGFFFKGEHGWTDAVTEGPDPTETTTEDELTRPTPGPPLQSVQADLTDCESLPKLDLPCGDKDPDAEGACELFKHVLTIEEVNWNSTKLMKANWRKDVLNLIVNIYQKVCPQVSKGLSPAVTRVVEYFIDKVAENPLTVEAVAPTTPTVPETPPATGSMKFKILNDPIRPEWLNHLIPDLNRCHKQAEKMPFFRTKDIISEMRKKEIEKMVEDNARMNTSINLQKLEDEIRDVHIQFPYHIWLPALLPPENWINSSQIQVREHVEAAEIDYNLDWAVDTFWKVFSTVLGYCNKEYRIRTATFKQLYSYYAQDILDLIVEQWVQDATRDATTYVLGNYEKVYEQLFGEYIYGVQSRYIDACNDGSYWWADVPDYRPVRPVYLKEGATQGGSPRPVNFFIEHPLFPSDPNLHAKPDPLFRVIE